MKRYSKLYLSKNEYIDFKNKSVVVFNDVYNLTKQQFKLLEYLSNHNTYINNKELGTYLDTSTEGIRNVISKLKNKYKLKDYIDNKKDLGYKLSIPADAPEPEYMNYDKKDLVEIMYDGINFEATQKYLDKLAILEQEIDNYSKNYRELLNTNDDREINFLLDYYYEKLKELVSKEEELTQQFNRQKEESLQCSAPGTIRCRPNILYYFGMNNYNSNNHSNELNSNDKVEHKLHVLNSKLYELEADINSRLNAPRNNFAILTSLSFDKENCIFCLIKKSEFHIGHSNDSTNDLVLDNPCISRLHATITYKNGNYHITDNNSLNGTYINDKKIPIRKETPLNSGDNIRLGDLKLSFEINNK